MQAVKRSIEEVLENQRRCRPGDYDREIFEIAYKSRVGIPLTPREREISDAYFKRRY